MKRVALVMLIVFASACGAPVKTSEQISQMSRHELQTYWEDLNSRRPVIASDRLTQLRTEVRWAALRDDDRWSEEDRRNAAAGRIWEGMPRELLYWSWGPPWTRTVTNTTWGRTETWDYSDYSYARPRIVYLREGVVSWWHVEGRP